MDAIVGDAREMPFTPEFFAPFDGVLWAAQLMLEEEEERRFLLKQEEKRKRKALKKQMELK